MKCKIVKVAGTQKYPYAVIVKIGFWVTDRICSEEKAEKIKSIGESTDNLREIKLRLAYKSVDLSMISATLTGQAVN